MAGTTQSKREDAMLDGATRAVRVQLNALVDDVEVLRAALNTLATNFNAALTKLDADVGVTDTNYNATSAVVRTTYDAAADLLAAKVANENGVTTA